MKRPLDKEKLEDLIKIKRKEMYSAAYTLGFTHPQVVACSQDLDVLINHYQGIQCAS